MKCEAIMGYLFRTRRCVGEVVGMSVMWREGEGEAKGSKGFLGVGVGGSSLGMGFLAREGQ